MTHSSRLTVLPVLTETFAQARTDSGTTRWLKVLLDTEAEEVRLAGKGSLGEDLETDWPSLESQLETGKPCYVLCRLDSRGAGGWHWMLISFVPDGSPVKQRMLYASSREHLMRELGKRYFKEKWSGSQPDEFTWDMFQQHMNKQGVAEDAGWIRKKEFDHYEYKVDPAENLAAPTTTEYVHSVKFPLSSDAQSSLKQIVKGKNCVQLHVDPDKETIELLGIHNLSSASKLAGVIPSEGPCYTFYRYKHSHLGSTFDSNVFIYSCPSGSKVKLRMLHSTVKAVVADAAAQAGFSVDRAGKIEVNEPSDVTEELLLDNLHPKVVATTRFTRPMRPGRGPRSLPKRKGRK
jgi:twinfilin-like protein